MPRLTDRQVAQVCFEADRALSRTLSEPPTVHWSTLSEAEQTKAGALVTKAYVNRGPAPDMSPSVMHERLFEAISRALGPE
jgi:hypothetical protein